MSEEVKRDELGRFVKGSSGCPTGRTPGSRSFATLILEEFEKEVEDGPDSTTQVKQLFAKMIVEILTTGKFKSLDGEERIIPTKEILPFLMKVWDKIEPNATMLDITSGGEKIDFGHATDSELEKFIASRIGIALEGVGGGGEKGLGGETPED